MEEAIKANPENADLYLRQGNYYFMRKQNDMAERSYFTAIEKDPQNNKPYLAVAGFYDAVGNKDKVLPMYNKALEVSPQDFGIMNTIAGYHFQNKAFDKKKLDEHKTEADTEKIDHLQTRRSVSAF